jgi:hypothetical protein
MKIGKYKEISDNVQVSDAVWTGYQNAIEQIKMEKETDTNVVEISKWKSINTLSKIAIVFGAVILLSSGTILSVKAYIRHLEKMRNMEAEEVIDLYENIFQYDRKYMSRDMSEDEDRRFSVLYDLYCRDMAEPEGEVTVIFSKDEYSGEGIAFSKEDGILILPTQEMTDEEILQLVVFNLLGRYVDYEAYVKASNPLYYLNILEQMTMQEVDELYINYYSANTETSFYNRELSIDELGRRKVLKMLYKSGEMQPEHTIPVIQEESEYGGEDIAFCVNNCTFYFPNDELSDEQLLELIDFQMKVDYCRQRIEDEIERGIRSDWPYIEYVERERIVTLDSDVKVDEEILSQQWLKAYEEILREYYRENSTYYENPERYYANVCFIYLNDDEIPEMLFSHGCTDLDYDDNCNLRNYLYTYKDGEAVLMTPGENTMDDFYGYSKPFSYVEQKGMVYCDYYYIYGFSTYDNETDIIDNVRDSMSRMDVWDFDTMTCTSSNANIEMEHAVYNYIEEEYTDANFSVEYYVNVSDIIRDENTGYVKEIIGEKVNRQTYEKSEAGLWDGEQITTLSISDYDKIYPDNNLLEALAKCYLKNRM